MLAAMPSAYSSECLKYLHQETNTVLSTCLSRLCSCQLNKDDISTSLQEHCKELQQILVKLRSLPPTVGGMVLELSVLYNIIYTSLLKVSLGNKLHSNLMTDYEHTILRSLQRVERLVGTDTAVDPASTETRLQKETSPMTRVPLVVSELINILLAVKSDGLCSAVGLVGCLWSFVCLQEQGPSISLSHLLPVLDATSDVNTKVLLRHGFVTPVYSTPLPVSTPSEKQINSLVHAATGTAGSTSGNMHRGVDELNGGEIPLSLLVQSMAGLLTAVSNFHRGELEECRQRVSKVNHTRWSSLATILTARAMLQGGRCLEAVGVLHTLLDSDRLGGVDVRSCVYRLLAACYSAQNLPHLSVEMYRRCLQLKPDDVSALYTLALQFRSLEQTEAEIQCLTLIAKILDDQRGLEKATLSMLPLLDSLLHKLVTTEDELSRSQAVYILASRCRQLQRFSESAKWYLKLIEVHQSDEAKGHGQHQLVQVPDFLTVCREAAQSLLQSHQHEKCLELCNKILTAVSAFPSSADFQLGQSFMSQSHNDSFGALSGTAVSQKTVTLTEKDFVNPVKTGRKRRLSSTGEADLDASHEENREGDWTKAKNEALVLVCMAQALVCKGDNTVAVCILNRSLDRLLACQGGSGGQRAHEKDVGEEQAVTSDSKRPRFASGVSCDRNDLQTAESEDDDWSTLTCGVCVGLADLSSRSKEECQALHFSRLAVQLRPDTESAQYCLASSLTQLGRGSDGCQPWLRLRKLPHNTGSIHLHGSLRERQELLTNLPTVAEDTRQLGVITERQKLELDIQCLQILVDAKQKKINDQRNC